MSILAVTALVSFGITAVMGKWFIPYLHKIKYGQNIIEEYGPTWHKNKQGTPTMGGIMFILGIVFSTAVGYIIYLLTTNTLTNETYTTTRLLLALCMALCYGALGFLDDYIKIVKKHNMGLTSKQKFILQLVIGGAYLLINYLVDKTYDMSTTAMQIPFTNYYVNLGLFYYPVALFIIVGFVNAVNLTDGIDGLASSVTFVAALGLIVLTGITYYFEMSIVSAALAGGTLGFLVWNFHPAKVFMGDTGSMFLGGVVVAVCFAIKQPLLLILVGVVYLCEAFSVILQVISFKTTGKRIFKMSPIHHHFEMSGFSEQKIVYTFSAVSLIGSILAVISALITR
jgi:phospho-N-acetylmuramoyl-pentapeptide-transferase